MEENIRTDYRTFHRTASTADKAINDCTDHARFFIETNDLHVVNWMHDLCVTELDNGITYTYVIGVAFLITE
jgi:hypothetical protein